jgi:hypothetical protein
MSDLKVLHINPIRCTHLIYNEKTEMSRECSQVATHMLEGAYACYGCVIAHYREKCAMLEEQLTQIRESQDWSRSSAGPNPDQFEPHGPSPKDAEEPL